MATLARNTFAAGDAIIASDMNSNFTNVENLVNQVLSGNESFTSLVATGTASFAALTATGTVTANAFSTTGAVTAAGGFAGNVTGNVTGSSGSCTGNAATASEWLNARTLTVDGDMTGSVIIDGSGDVSLTLSAALEAADIPDLNANKITAGTFHVDRIPSLSGAKIGSGIVSATYIDTAIARNANVYGFGSSSVATYNITTGSGSGTPSSSVHPSPQNGDIHIWY